MRLNYLTPQGFKELETELLNGQKLQGAETAADVHNFLVAHGLGDAERAQKYPLFENVWKICFQVSIIPLDRGASAYG